MIYNLQNGDQILFIKNLLEDGSYGDNIFVQEIYWLQDQQTYLIDDPNMKIFPYLKEIYWEKRKQIHFFNLTPSTRYYTYALVNGEYKIVKFGRKIYQMIMDFIETHNYYPNRVFNVDIKNKSGFPCYDDCFFTNTVIEQPSEQLLSTKTINLEDIGKHHMWTIDINYNKLMDFFKKNDIDINPIQVLKTKQRQKKLERILS